MFLVSDGSCYVALYQIENLVIMRILFLFTLIPLFSFSLIFNLFVHVDSFRCVSNHTLNLY